MSKVWVIIKHIFGTNYDDDRNEILSYHPNKKEAEMYADLLNKENSKNFNVAFSARKIRVHE